MKSQQPKPVSATILTWLRANGLNLGALTGHDTAALQAATQIAALWIRADDDNRSNCALAFRHCVTQMQASTQHLAFHAIAHAGDWHHRRQLWNEAHLDFPANAPDCTSAPR